jgi:hypothetical protein
VARQVGFYNELGLGGLEGQMSKARTDDAIKEFLDRGGKVTHVPTGKRTLTPDGKKRKAGSRNAKERRTATPTAKRQADEAATSDCRPRPNSRTEAERLEREAEDIIPDGIQEQPSAADDDER